MTKKGPLGSKTYWGASGGDTVSLELKACAFCGRNFFPEKATQAFCDWQCQAKLEEAREFGEATDRYCCVCGNRLEAGRRDYWCSRTCRESEEAAEREEPKTWANKGATAELRVAVDLLERGYHVFRSVTLHCPCDLVAWRPGKRVWRVEVKQTAGKMAWARQSSKANQYDVLAVAVQGEAIAYLTPTGKRLDM